MSTQSNAISESFQAQSVAPVAFPATRALYWSVRGELWENRSVYIAPLAVAAVALLAFLISTPGHWEIALRHPAQPRGVIAQPYDFAAGLMMLTGILVSVFYCLDALHSERRDRSILFWKSLPVSDLTTVLAKASIPLVILPLLTVAIAFAMQWIMLLMSSVAVLANGQSVATLWRNISFIRMSWLMLYHVLTVHALWPAPVYCWLLLVSGWPRRATFLWAALPLVAIAGVEQIVSHSWHFATLVGGRLIGASSPVATTPPDMFPTAPMIHISPGPFVTSPSLWIGLALAAIFLAVTVRMRRYQEPI